MKYQTRVYGVEALQWTGSNLEEVQGLCPGVCALSSKPALLLPKSQEHRSSVVLVGDYIVRELSGACFAMRASQFTEIYEVTLPTQGCRVNKC